MKIRRIGAFLAAGALFLTLASSTFASTSLTFNWGGNGYPNNTCTAGSATMLWVWTGDSPTSLTINGQLQSGSWVQQGGGAWHFTTSLNGTNYPPVSASITYTGKSGVLTLSHCDGTTTTTTTSTTTTTTTDGTTSTTTTTTTGTTTTTTTGTTTTGTTTTGTTTSGTTTSGTTTSGTTTSGTTSSETTGTTSSVTTSAFTPQGSVLAETGSPTVTPPSTDALGSASRTPSGAWNLVLALGVLMSLSILVLTPMAKSRRRK